MDEAVGAIFKGAKEPEWLEKLVLGNLRVWQVVFLAFAVFLACTIALCCCLRFRVPRTKQQIEANYQRRIITKKFRQQLEKIQNSEMDSIDLKAALDIIRINLKSDLEGEKDQQHSVSLMSSVVSPVQSLDEASFKSSHSLNSKQQVEPELETKPNSTIKDKFNKITIFMRSFKQKQEEKVDIY